MSLQQDEILDSSGRGLNDLENLASVRSEEAVERAEGRHGCEIQERKGHFDFSRGGRLHHQLREARMVEGVFSCLYILLLLVF